MSSPNLFFSTPVWATKIKDYLTMNEKIYSYIKDLENHDKQGVIKSNVKGWHSKNFSLKDETPKEFINLISQNINQVFKDMDWDLENQITKITNMWTIINRKGALR